MPQPSRSWKRILAVVIAGLCGAALGTQLGEILAYALARAVDRDIAELKGTLISFILLTPPTMAVVSAAAALVALRSKWRRSASIGAASLVVVVAAFITVGYEWPKSSGTPVVDYELLLPDGVEVTGRNQIDLTIWNGKSGQGCYIRDIGFSDKRQLIAGSIVLHTDNADPTLSIVLGDGERWHRAGVWEFPYRPNDQIETSFRPWQDVAFQRNAHDLPLPVGDFKIRYRLRSFM